MYVCVCVCVCVYISIYSFIYLIHAYIIFLKVHIINIIIIGMSCTSNKDHTLVQQKYLMNYVQSSCKSVKH